MLSKIISKLKTPAILYTLSSLIYSFSTYIIVLLIPYKLNLNSMADFSASLNIVMMLSFVFEFGVVTSYLRYNQLYGVTRYVNAYLQLGIFLLMFFMAGTFLGNYIDKFFGANNITMDSGYIYFSAFAILSWVFFKNIFLANKKINIIFINSLILAVIRVVLLGYILLSSTHFSMDEIYLYLFIFPFVLIIFFNLKYDLKAFIESFEYVKNNIDRKIFLKRAKQIIIFAFATYIISVLYVYTSRYAIIYLTKLNAVKLIAELGYATSFGGLIIVFAVSIRSYLISKFNISNTKEIKKYIDTVSSYKYKFILASLLFSSLLALLVYIIKPNYLSINSAIFVFILVQAYLSSSYLGMFSLLSKTFNFNNLELKLNVLRLILVILWVHNVLIDYPIAGFLGLNVSMVLVEMFFAKIVLERVDKKA